MQKDILDTQTQAKATVSLPTRLIRDANTFAKTFLANVNEDIARAYSVEIIKLATSLVDYSTKQISYRPRVVSYPPMDPGPSHSLSFSPILHPQQQNLTIHRGHLGEVRHHRMGGPRQHPCLDQEWRSRLCRF